MVWKQRVNLGPGAAATGTRECNLDDTKPNRFIPVSDLPTLSVTIVQELIRGYIRLKHDHRPYLSVLYDIPMGL